MAESTVWTQLSSPNSPVGSVPFVDNDNVTIKTDVLNFKYTSDQPISQLTGSFRPKQLTIDGGLRICSDDLTAQPGVPQVTINKPMGKVIIPGGSANVQVASTYCINGAFVFLQLESNDATLTQVHTNGIGFGVFNIQGNANATGSVRVAFMIVNTF